MVVRVVIGEYTRYESGECVHHPAKEILVNPDCPIRIAYDYIQKALNIDLSQEFDLSDENGNLVFIYEKEPWTNGTNHLVPKTTYFVVFFTRDEEARGLCPMIQMPEFFKKSCNQWNEIVAKIKKQLNPGSNTRVSRASKTRLSTSYLNCTTMIPILVMMVVKISKARISTLLHPFEPTGTNYGAPSSTST